MSEKKQYIKVEFFSCGQSCGWYISEPRCALDGVSILNLDPEDSYMFTCVEMTLEEVEALPEFEGF